MISTTTSRLPSAFISGRGAFRQVAILQAAGVIGMPLAFVVTMNLLNAIYPTVPKTPEPPPLRATPTLEPSPVDLQHAAPSPRPVNSKPAEIADNYGIQWFTTKGQMAQLAGPANDPSYKLGSVFYNWQTGSTLTNPLLPNSDVSVVDYGDLFSSYANKKLYPCISDKGCDFAAAVEAAAEPKPMASRPFSLTVPADQLAVSYNKDGTVTVTIVPKEAARLAPQAGTGFPTMTLDKHSVSVHE